MKPDETILLFLTFVTGVFAGAAFYLMVYGPANNASPVAERPRFSIVGEMYGGCEFSQIGCDSFRYTADGSYQYVSKGERFSGELPTQLQTKIDALMTSNQIAALAEPASGKQCASQIDGIDFRYDVSLETGRYRLDTCETLLERQSPQQQLFAEAWSYMRDPKSQYPDILEKGIGGWLIDRFQGPYKQ